MTGKQLKFKKNYQGTSRKREFFEFQSIARNVVEKNAGVGRLKQNSLSLYWSTKNRNKLPGIKQFFEVQNMQFEKFTFLIIEHTVDTVQ